MPYSTAADLHAHGVPRGASPNPGRVCASAVSNVCALDGHDFATGDEIVFRPAGAGAMPAGLVEGTTYYAERVSDFTFKVRATAGGASIAFDDADDPLMVVAPLNRDAAIEFADRLIDDMTPGQKHPFDDTTLYPDGVPAIIRITSAELASGKLLASSGSASRSMAEILDAAQKRLTRWSAGLPIANTPDESRAQVAAGAVAPYADRRGWNQWGGI